MKCGASKISLTRLCAIAAVSLTCLMTTLAIAVPLPAGFEFLSNGEVAAACSPILRDAAFVTYGESVNAEFERRAGVVWQARALDRWSIAAEQMETGVGSDRARELAAFVRNANVPDSTRQFQYCADLGRYATMAMGDWDLTRVDAIVNNHFARLDVLGRNWRSGDDVPDSERPPKPTGGGGGNHSGGNALQGRLGLTR